MTLISSRSCVLRGAALALGVAVFVSACGDESQPTYSPRVAQQLSADADAVRAAAEAGDADAAQRALHTLTRHVAAAQARDEIPSDKARQILRATDWVAQDLPALSTPTPSPPPRSEGEPEDDENRRHEEDRGRHQKDDEKGEEDKEDKSDKGRGEEDKTGEHD